MSVKSKMGREPLSTGKKKSSKSKVRVGVPTLMRKTSSVKGSSTVKHPKNAEEATLLAWEKTYENRNKRFKI